MSNLSYWTIVALIIVGVFGIAWLGGAFHAPTCERTVKQVVKVRAGEWILADVCAPSP